MVIICWKSQVDLIDLTQTLGGISRPFHRLGGLGCDQVGRTSVLVCLMFCLGKADAIAEENSGCLSDASYLPRGDKSLQIRKTPGFVIGYSGSRKQAIWVAYHLTEQERRGTVKRTDDFRSDAKILNGAAFLTDYKGSGFDRGHLAPAGDMKWSMSAMSHSFLLSNISPQLRQFNAGIWLELENSIRYFVKKNRQPLYVVTGPIFEGAPRTIGENNVFVPSHYWKVIYDCRGEDITAYLLPHVRNPNILRDYIVSVDRLEHLTGLDFFSALPNQLESSLEKNLGDFNQDPLSNDR